MSLLKRYLYQLLGALAAVTYLIVGIFKSTNSTASIGFIFIPFFAVFGAFLGDTVKYLKDVIQGTRAHSPKKTILIILVLSFCAFKGIQSYLKELEIKKASSTTSHEELQSLLKKDVPEIIKAATENPMLSEKDLQFLMDRYLKDYYVMSGVAQHPALTTNQMKKIALLKKENFRGEVEYHLYQTYVWTKLLKRTNLPEPLIHLLASKEDPQHFFIIALVESAYLNCEERKHFLPQKNMVLENMILKSMEDKNCI